MKSNLIILTVAFAIFLSMFLVFWFSFAQFYFNATNRNMMLGILIAIIFAAFQLAFALSNSLKIFNWKEFKRAKTPTELKLIACECMAEAGMMEREIAKQLEDRMKTIDDNHNIELIRMKADTRKEK